MKPPLITVYITNHNYGKYIEQAVESVLRQTFRDFDLIIIDDGSTDNSRDIIEKYRGMDNVFIVYQKNKGLNITNNIALKMARGKHIMRLDADDYLDENALSVLFGVLERNEEVGLVFPDYYMVDHFGNVTEIVCRHNFDSVTLMDQPAHGACTMIRKKCLEEIGGYDEIFRCQDGYDLWVRFIHKYKVKNVNLPLFYYRQHPNSITKNESRILKTRSEIIRKHICANGMLPSAVGIVPVRGRIANPASQAMRPLAGKPLLEWTLDAALEACRLESVILTTPDPESLNHAQKRYGNRIIAVQRDLKYAAFNTNVADSARHALEMYIQNHQQPDAVAILFIECPFRDAEHIDNAVEMLGLYDADTVVGVRPEFSYIYQHHSNGMQSVRRTNSLRLEREDLYRDSGRLHVVKRAFLEKENKIFGNRVGHVVVSQDAALALLSDWDWEVAEFLAHKRLLHQPRHRAKESL